MMRQRKLLLMILLAALVCTLLPGAALAAGETSGTCGLDLTWTLEDGTLTISGTGEMNSYAYGVEPPWYVKRSSVTSVVVEPGVTAVGSYAFAEMTKLTSVQLPEGLLLLDSEAFHGCSRLTSVELPESLTALGSGVFYDCSKLTGIVLPAGLTAIGISEFMGCSSMTNVTIPDSVLTIGDNAFYGCSSLTEIELPEQLVQIGGTAFADCSSLTELEIPDSVTEIGDAAFAGCSALKSIKLPDSLEVILDYAFQSCSSLTELEIPDSVTELGERVFEGCGNLTSVSLSAGIDTVGNWPFGNARFSDVYFDGTEAEWAEFEAASNIGYVETTSGYAESLGLPGEPRAYTVHFLQASGSCGADAVWQLYEGGELIVSGAGTAEAPDASLDPLRGSIVRITVRPGVTGIADGAFDGFGKLEEVSLPETLASIGKDAFGDCGTINYPGRKSQWDAVSGSADIPIENVHFSTHDLEWCAGEAATCLAPGCKSHYSCSDCGRYFSDMMEEIEEGSWIEPQLSHAIWYVEEVPATTTSDGVRGHYECWMCSGCFMDEAGLQPVDRASLAFSVNSGGPMILLSDASGSMGGTVQVTVTIRDNPGIADLKLYIYYDAYALTLIDVQDGGILGDSLFDEYYGNWPYTLYWNNDLAETDYNGNGVIATLTFQINYGAVDGDYLVRLTCEEGLNSDMQPVSFTPISSSVTVGGFVLFGDVNGDGKINSKDSMFLARHLAMWDGYENLPVPAAADVNADGNLNSKDGMILARYIAQWSGYENLPKLY